MWCVHLANPIEKSKWKITTACFFYCSLFISLFQFNFTNTFRLCPTVSWCGRNNCPACCMRSHTIEIRECWTKYSINNLVQNRIVWHVIYTTTMLSHLCANNFAIAAEAAATSTVARRFFCPLRPGAERLYHFHFSTSTKLSCRRLFNRTFVVISRMLVTSVCLMYYVCRLRLEVATSLAGTATIQTAENKFDLCANATQTNCTKTDGKLFVISFIAADAKSSAHFAITTYTAHHSHSRDN